MSRRNRRKKYIPPKSNNKNKKNSSGRAALIAIVAVIVIIVAFVSVSLLLSQKNKADLSNEFEHKAQLLKSELESSDSAAYEISIEGAPSHVVFISVCDGDSRAKVFTGKGSDVEKAFNDAENQAHEYINENNYSPLWVKADVVTNAGKYTAPTFRSTLAEYRHEFFRSGLAFDVNFNTALLEAELNGAKILDYDANYIDFSYLNTYLRKAGRTELAQLPDDYIIFDCKGWLCDEDSQILELYSEPEEYGRRIVDTIDKEFVSDIVTNASSFLIDQVKPNGSFVYGMYPRFDHDIDNYNIVRHASTLWSLVCQYRMTGNKDLVSVIESAIDYLIDNAVVYSDDNTAYLLEDKSSEIKLGGCGVAVIALTEYMDAFDSDKYQKVAEKLGNGILTMLDQESGEYYHVLNKDYSHKEAFRTVYYDGEATFALCRLYKLTGDEKWLNAAKSAVEHFIDADYVQYKDHWVAYTMNEITKYVDDERYYTFALRNAQENLKRIYNRDTTYHTYLELLMATFEIYDRMLQNGIDIPYLHNGFDADYFLQTIYKRADHMLNGYFFPEYAMYMENPNRVLDTFMVRHDGYRVRIDDVQHNIGGYYLYYLNYDRLVECGMLEQ